MCKWGRTALTHVHRSTWKMEPSLPPQNMWCSARSKVTAMMATSKKTERRRSPEEISQSWGHRGAEGLESPGVQGRGHWGWKLKAQGTGYP